ncbi:MAG: hypothetical protein LIR50_13930 [Bacillota bacterium]|nr:hypothetical protein [Bacillota bacterium]
MITFKDLSIKEKIEHIWYYYKGIIIFGLAAVIIVSYLIGNFINKTDNVFNISLMAGSVDSIKEDALEKDLTKFLIGEKPGKKRAGFEDYQLASNNGKLSLDLNNAEKFLITLNAGTSDLVIMPEDIYDNYKDKQIFEDLTKLSSFDYKEYKVMDNYFISLDKSTKIKAVVKSTEKLYAAIPAAAKDKEKSLECLKYLLK